MLGAGGARQPGAADFDPVRLTLSLATLGLSGYELERRLRTDHALAVEAADPHNVVVNITFGDSPATVDRLVDAVAGVAAQAGRQSGGAAGAAGAAGQSSGAAGTAAAQGVAEAAGRSGNEAASPASPPLPLFTRQVCSPRDAFFGPAEVVSLADCAGWVSAEMVVPYPPGIPVLGPGEEISGETVAYLAEAARRGVLVHGPRDLTLATLRVVAGDRSTGGRSTTA